MAALEYRHLQEDEHVARWGRRLTSHHA